MHLYGGCEGNLFLGFPALKAFILFAGKQQDAVQLGLGFWCKSFPEVAVVGRGQRLSNWEAVPWIYLNNINILFSQVLGMTGKIPVEL